MVNRRAPFRQVDVTRALRAAKAAGVKVSRFEIDAAGKITVFDADSNQLAPPLAGRSALDKWKDEDMAERERKAEQQRLEKEAAQKWRAEAAAKSNAKRH